MGNIQKINNDVFIGIILAAFSGFFFFEATKLHREAAQFPKIILGIFLVMSLALLVLGIRKTFRPDLVLPSDMQLNIKLCFNPMIVLLLVTGYLVLMYFARFFVATAVFVPVMMLFYGVRNIKVLVITDIVLNLFVFGLFVKILKVMLP